MNTYLALVIFIIACVSGHQYRRVWKAEGPSWQLWVFGCTTAVGLLSLAFIPIA
ncbi:MAG: hypothetical protein AAGG69_08295 [Pseudomonadota bacterium]